MTAAKQVELTGTTGRHGLISPGLISKVAGYLAMAVVVCVIGLPLLWLLSGAFKEVSEFYLVPATLLPLDPTIQNFPRAWYAATFGVY